MSFCLLISELMNMKDDYERSPIAERQSWRENLLKRFVNNDNNQTDNQNLIEKSVKFIR